MESQDPIRKDYTESSTTKDEVVLSGSLRWMKAGASMERGALDEVLSVKTR